MKKLFMMFAVMTACAACEKDDGGITMEADRLEGTYWKQTRMECSEYRDGRWEKTLDYGFDGSLDGGGGPMVLFFASGTTLVEYGRLAMTGPDRPTAYRKTRTFDYRPGEKLFLTYGPNGESDDRMDLETFTPGMIVWESVAEYTEPCGSSYQVLTRETFRRFEPDEAWKQSAAQYPDYDEVDWSALR